MRHKVADTVPGDGCKPTTPANRWRKYVWLECEFIARHADIHAYGASGAVVHEKLAT